MILSTINQPVGLTCQQLTNADYHADEAIGASQIEDFYKSRRLFQGRYVTKTIPRKTATPAMQLGTLIHLRILEPERYTESVVIAPADAPDRRSRNWWKDFDSVNEGKEIITTATSAQIEAIAESVFSKRWATRLLRGDGQPEQSIFWVDKETGLNLKCRVDWFSTISIDLKTTADPSPAAYARALVGLGYARKLAHYRAGIAAFTADEATFLHVTVGTEAPYACGCYEIDDRDYYDVLTPSLGEKQWRRTLREIQACYDSGDWSDVFEREIMTLRLPQFAFTEDQWRTA